MKAAKIIHGVALLSLGYDIAKRAIFLLDASSPVGAALALGVWLFLWWMLFRRPQGWGLGVGIFSLCAVISQIVLWRVALTGPKETAAGVSPSWLKLGLSLVPLLVGSICSISLRWLVREAPNQAPSS